MDLLKEELNKKHIQLKEKVQSPPPPFSPEAFARALASKDRRIRWSKKVTIGEAGSLKAGSREQGAQSTGPSY